jgi:hypothetical protein
MHGRVREEKLCIIAVIKSCVRREFRTRLGLCSAKKNESETMLKRTVDMWYFQVWNRQEKGHGINSP